MIYYYVEAQKIFSKKVHRTCLKYVLYSQGKLNFSIKKKYKESKKSRSNFLEYNCNTQNINRINVQNLYRLQQTNLKNKLRKGQKNINRDFIE